MVVFPAPFGPTSPKKHPCGMSRSIPATATLAPNDLRSPRTDNAAGERPTDGPGAGSPVLTPEAYPPGEAKNHAAAAASRSWKRASASAAPS